jgi:hypothetical protein
MALSMQSALIALAGFVVFKVAARFLGTSALDKIRGPPRASIVTGNAVHVAGLHASLDTHYEGNLRQLLSLDGWGFHQDISAEYGGIVKIWGILGVGAFRAMSHFISD